MSTLQLEYNGTNIVSASIDGNAIPTPTAITQNLQRGVLVAQITLPFDEVIIGAASATPAPALTATFAADGANGTTITVTDTAGVGNRFAYRYATSAVATPKVGDSVTGTTDLSGQTGTVVTTAAGNYLAVYELTTANTVVKFVNHQLTAAEVGAGVSGDAPQNSVPAKVGAVKVGATN